MIAKVKGNIRYWDCLIIKNHQARRSKFFESVDAIACENANGNKYICVEPVQKNHYFTLKTNTWTTTTM